MLDEIIAYSLLYCKSLSFSEYKYITQGDIFMVKQYSVITTCAVSMAFLLQSTTALSAQTVEEYDRTVMERVTVVGSTQKAKDITGSAHYVGKEVLDQYGYGDVHRVLKQVPGVNVQEEEGYGNRPNIGLRGGRSERSADITLMEDGVLIAPAPYAASSAYYFPRVARMAGVEVRKGSSTIKYGPRTTSGVVNLISSPIPSELSGKAVFAIGEDNTQRSQLNIGNSAKNWGYVFDLLHEGTDGFKQLDTGEDTGYSIQDGMVKLRYNTDPTATYYQSFELKLGRTHEDSDESYLGLTQADFNATPYRRYAASQRDNMDADHNQYQLRHYIDLNDDMDLTTTVYRNDFKRNWYKLQSVSDGDTKLNLNPALASASHLAALKGEGDADDRFNIRANNREYESQGIQTQFTKKVALGRFQNMIEVGVRYHEDEEDRFQREDTYFFDNGQLVLDRVGAPGSNANRVGSAKATAVYIQDEITTGKWTFVPGVRYEYIRLKREDYGSDDPNRTGENLKVTKNDISVVVPGVGVGYKVNEHLSLLAGIHKGFAPPAPPSASTQQAEEEESVNYEAGLRYARGAFNAELIGFFNDYDNLLGEETLSSGTGEGSGEQFNGGEVQVVGVEFTAGYDLAEHIKLGYQLPVALGYTFTQAEFKSSFESSFEEWGSVQDGDELPYVPEHQLFLSAGIVDDVWNMYVSAKYVDEMRTVAGSGEVTAEDSTDEHFIVDLAAEREVYKDTRMFVTVDNVFDEEYVAARRPAGARPGKPRTVLTGVKITF